MASTNSPIRDENTQSNYNVWRTSHTKVDLQIGFEEKKVTGTVSLTLKSLVDNNKSEIILDSSHLDISDVTIDSKKSKWELLPRKEPYGSPLKLHLPNSASKDQQIQVEIGLSTTKECTALQWLSPEQTSTGKHPYMFSQCQAIHARSIFPCQDTPDVKSTFEFTIHSSLPVIASGIPSPSNPASAASDPQIYTFNQPVPIPSYLFALASGDLASAPIGPRSTVVTSPDQLAKCKSELEADTDSFIQAAEKIIYPYAWGQYNVLILPASFPYGGMENPIYTFATPTIISGDRSNVDVIAHELAHSWSGNLVTNASWTHFWLNEGWTTYLERRIQASIHGDDRWRDFSALIGWQALEESVAQFGPDHEFTKLVPNLKNQDPDDAFSSVPYEKGYTFLLYLEKQLGRKAFDNFIPSYFSTWRGRSLDSFEFRTTLSDFFAADAVATQTLKDVDWDTWFYKPGLPPRPDFDTTLVQPAYDLADKWASLTGSSSPFTPHESDISGLSGQHLIVFLERILSLPSPLPASLAAQMGTLYAFQSSGNVELSSRWCRVAMAAGDRGCLDTVVRLLGQVGRMKFVRPLFKGLVKVDRGLAWRVVKSDKDRGGFWHPICRAMVERLLREAEAEVGAETESEALAGKGEKEKEAGKGGSCAVF